jgi:nicotinic acid mononucleotide adenylyltransferase
MQKVNIVIGRFQPFTTGHYLCAMAAMRKKGLKTVVCMMNVPEYKVDERHPFPSDMLISLYNNLLTNDPYIADVVTVPSADIVKVSEILRSYNYQIAAWTCGTDRYPQYSVQAARYHDRAGLTDDFEVIKVQRDLEKDVSATKARNCLLNNDKAGFLSMIPSGQNEDELYSTLKEQIDIVYGVNESLLRRVLRLEKLVRKLHVK